MNHKIKPVLLLIYLCAFSSFGQWCENLDQSDKQIISNVIYEKLLKHKDSLAFRKSISSSCLTKFHNNKVKFFTANDLYSNLIDDYLDVEFIAFENSITRVIITNHKLNTIYNFNFKKVENRWQLLNESDYLIQGRLKYVDFLYEQVKEKKN
ncbi:hypothetical protein FJ651_03940 [Paucihalobacter ruber]|uniref:DUF4878 domain-containing protein n=1 Tax=Paucihalobacter ruber TaxID=2567861 RepID=A0A506PLU1_9FLAO|nr:hypothetical protein [Paucihalobacter ruber]TPV34691.1 hypothetical protein FJ651_03940 [Paucihalobacter ruber]